MIEILLPIAFYLMLFSLPIIVSITFTNPRNAPLLILNILILVTLFYVPKLLQTTNNQEKRNITMTIDQKKLSFSLPRSDIYCIEQGSRVNYTKNNEIITFLPSDVTSDLSNDDRKISVLDTSCTKKVITLPEENHEKP